MSTKNVVILGAGGFAREVADIFRVLDDSQGLRLIGFVDRDDSNRGEVLNDTEVLGTLDDVKHVENLFAIPGSGDLGPRSRQIAEIEAAGLPTITVIHPSVVMSPFVEVGSGTVITAGNILTNGITIGNWVVINLACTIGHDASIGDGTVIAPGAHVSGWCSIGKNCYIGTGAVLLPRVTIGDGAVVGAGAVVNKDVEASTTVVGIPAKPLGRRA